MGKIKEKEREWLMEQPQFQNFLFDILSNSGICTFTRDEQTALHLEGRRSLGLEILGWFGENSNPLDTITVITRNQPKPQGTKNDRRDDSHD